jgi:peptidoglycan/LPS O-acetylase OafA/YrhL
VRGMAILMVLLFHFWQGMTVYQHPFSPSVTRAMSLLSIGQKGVDLFFVLSGFLITGILLHTKGSAHYFKNFYIRRALRIFPLYYLVVFGCLLAGCLWSLPQFEWGKNWWYLFYLQNIGMTFWPKNVAGPGHFWSLAVEEHFYLLWPLVVLLCNRRRLMFVTLSIIMASILIRAFFLMQALDVFTFTLCRIDTLALGAFLAILFTNPQVWHKVTQWTCWLIFPVMSLAFGSFFVLSGTGSPILQTFKYSLFAVLCGFVLILSLSPRRWNPAPVVFKFAWLRRMGKTSYAMYVFHPFIYGHILGRLYQATWSPVRGMLWPAIGAELATVLSLTILASWISWVIFEHPLIKLKDRFQYEDRNQTQTN